ncbi:hypothetical protein [Halobacteriovorax sp.]|uniref:hypothetical protein n=1 Tax=Halobacteriovorax sp. TaxID=2020862 RepID=UPI0035651F27
MQSFLSFADTEVDTFVETLDKFEEFCIDQNNELREDVYISDEFFSCRDTLDYLKVEFDNREELMSSNPDVYKQFQDCVEERENPKLVPFLNEVQEVTDNVACNESEKKEFEKSCGRAWECNKLRAIKDGAAVLPSIVRKPIQKFVRNTVREKNYDSECIADGKSNCIKDFVYAFAANLWSSASSVWDLVSKGTKSLFDIGGWFDDEADKLHAKAIQSQKDVEDFWDDPGKWFSNLIDNIKKGVDDWVRTSVFCGKWEGKPQFSKCLQPLENYDCIDCDDKINATCVAIGAISSEVGVAFLTAGVGTAASLTARAGAKTLAVVATKVSSKVKSVAPSFNKTNKVKVDNKFTRGVAAVGVGISKSTEVAKKIYSVTSDKALRIKGKIDNISTIVNESKVVMVTKAIVEKGNIPGRISEKIAEAGVLVGAKAVSKVGKGSVKVDADKVVRIAEKAKTSEKAQQILSKRTHEKSRLSGHNAKATSLVKRGEKASGGSSHVSGEGHISSSSSSSSSESSSSPTRRTAYDDRDYTKRENQVARQERPSRPEKSEKKITKKTKAEELQERREKLENKRKEVAERKKEEKKKLAEDKKHEESEHEEKSSSSVTKTAVAASLSSHLVAKGLVMSSEQAEREAEAIQDMANGKSERFTESLSSAKEVLGVQKVSAFSKGALKQAEVVKNMYSEENRDKIVSEIQKSNSDLSQSEADEIFNNRQGEVGKAYDYIDRLQKVSNRPTTTAKRSTAKSELKNLGRRNELSKLDKELAALSKERESIESGFSEVPSNIENQESSIVSNVVPTPAQSAINSRARATKEVASNESSPVGSSSGSSSSPSSSSPPSSNNGGSSNDTTSSSANDSVAKVGSSEGLPAIVDNELIEEAIENSKDPLELKDEKKEEERLKRSSGLKDLLSKIGSKNINIENGVLFTRNLASIKTSTAATRNLFLKLAQKVKNSEEVDKKYTYSIGKEKLELYQYQNETFHLKINESGVAELIDNEDGAKLISRSSFNID